MRILRPADALQATDLTISPTEWFRHALVATGLVLLCLIINAETGTRLRAQNVPAAQTHFLSSPVFLIVHGQDLKYMERAALTCLVIAIAMAVRHGSGSTIWGITTFAVVLEATVVHALGDSHLDGLLHRLWDVGLLALTVHYVAGHLLRRPLEAWLARRVLKSLEHPANGRDVARNTSALLGVAAMLTIAVYQLDWRLGRIQKPNQGFLTNVLITLHGTDLPIISWLAVGAVAVAVVLAFWCASELALASITLILGTYNLTLLNALGSDIMRTWFPRLWLVSLLPLILCLWANHRGPNARLQPFAHPGTAQPPL